MQIDCIGQRFGKLTIIGYEGGSRYYPAKRICKCDCGNICKVNINKLRSGHTTSCGCNKHGRHYIDLIGNRYNKLTVLSYHGKMNNHIQWNCVCDCGK